MKPLFAAVLACASMAVATAQESSLEHYQKGLRLLDELDLSSAAGEFEIALHGYTQPDWIVSSSRLRLAEIFNFTGDDERAQGLVSGALPDVERPRQIHPTTPGRTDPVVIEKISPEYSDEARVAELEGSVWVEADVGEDGMVREARVVRSLGLGLDEEAIQAVKQRRFTTGKPGTSTQEVKFMLPGKLSRWHLARAAFLLPEGALRPVFLAAPFPPGPGVSRGSMDEAGIIAAMDRAGTATLCFKVDEHGLPVHFRVQAASDAIWSAEAIALVSRWRFQPGTRDNMPIAIPALVTLVWGRRDMSADTLAALRFTLRAKPTEPDTAAPRVLYSFPPPYTEAARTAMLEGTVRVALIIRGDGAPENIHVVEPLGLGLDESAVEAVSHWRFSPAYLNGKPASMAFTIDVNFTLK